MAIDKESIEILEKEGLGEYTQTLFKAGFTSLRDVADNGVTEQDLEKIGMDKLFHRKKLIRIAKETVERHNATAATAASAASAASSSGNETPKEQQQQQQVTDEAATAAAAAVEARHTGGDHVYVEVLSARSATDQPLSEREHYVKVSLCSLRGRFVSAVDDVQPQKTIMSRGPFPNFVPPVTKGSSEEATGLTIPTHFPKTQCVSFELKEKKLLQSNNHVGIALFPMTFFLKFNDETIVQQWYPMRLFAGQSDSPVSSMIHLRFRVPGGAPGQMKRGVHMTAVDMRHRKLMVTVFDATVYKVATDPATSEEAALFTDPPSTCISLVIDNAEKHQRQRTSTVERSFDPCFDEKFHYEQEIASAKLLTVKLESVKALMRHETIGECKIPLQFFLAQANAEDMDKPFPLLDESKRECGRVHLRLQIKRSGAAKVVMDDKKKIVSFRKTPASSPSFRRAGSKQNTSFEAVDSPTQQQQKQQKQQEEQKPSTLQQHADPSPNTATTSSSSTATSTSATTTNVSLETVQSSVSTGAVPTPKKATMVTAETTTPSPSQGRRRVTTEKGEDGESDSDIEGGPVQDDLKLELSTMLNDIDDDVQLPSSDDDDGDDDDHDHDRQHDKKKQESGDANAGAAEKGKEKKSTFIDLDLDLSTPKKTIDDSML